MCVDDAREQAGWEWMEVDVRVDVGVWLSSYVMGGVRVLVGEWMSGCGWVSGWLGDPCFWWSGVLLVAMPVCTIFYLFYFY